MSDPRVSRKLAVIVSADVTGYSRLAAADEEGTITGLRAHRTELIDPKISEHGGGIANTAGDSLLIELPSVAAPVQVVNGLPQGVQLIGWRYHEDPCFDAAEIIEQQQGVFTPIEPLDTHRKV